jgi:hypothetical protein
MTELATTPDGGAAASSEDAASGSPLERLWQLSQAEQDEASLYLAIPGARWGGELIARIGIVGPDRARQRAEEIAANGADRDAADVNADLIATFVEGLYLRARGDAGVEPIPAAGGLPMRFGQEFAAEIGADWATTPREAVFATFTEGSPPVLNISALASFTREASTWLQDTSVAIEGAIVPGR